MEFERRSSQPWVVRSLLAGLLAAGVAVSIGWGNYFGLRGAMTIDWTLMFPIVLAYGGFTGVLAGLGLGGGMTIATRRAGPRVGLVRLMSGAVLGAVLGCWGPALVGIVGFGSLHAPYAGTGNILFCILVAATVFLAAFAPSLLPDQKLGLLGRLGVSAVAAGIASATLGTLGWLFVTQLDLLPSFPEMAWRVEQVGLVRFGVGAATVLGVGVGVFIGLATWLYLTLAIVVDRRTAVTAD